jgi:hypothetical protein
MTRYESFSRERAAEDLDFHRLHGEWYRAARSVVCSSSDLVDDHGTSIPRDHRSRRRGQKGGAEKTTLAVHLAVCCGDALIIDTDKQKSAVGW